MQRLVELPGHRARFGGHALVGNIGTMNRGSTLPANAVYITEKAEIEDDSNDGFEYTSVPVEGAYVENGANETFADTLKLVQDSKVLEPHATLSRARLNDRPEVLEDFIRNFLFRNGMTSTLRSFQTEWYEMVERGSISTDEAEPVPDCYARNNALLDEIEEERNKAAQEALALKRAKNAITKLKKERDYHRLAHRRVKEENAELNRTIERLTQHYTGIEESNVDLQSKYETVKRKAVVASLARDRTRKEVMGLSQRFEELAAATTQVVELEATAGGEDVGVGGADAGAGAGAGADGGGGGGGVEGMVAQSAPEEPIATNPVTVARAQQLKVRHTFQAHGRAVSAMAYHAGSTSLATGSDDSSFKLWEVGGSTDGKLLLEGKGHTSWIGGLDFHPQGSMLVTGSGDSTVKVWDLETAQCTATFAEHTHAVWDAVFHHSGDFLGSCSLDNTAKLWDVNSLTCVDTLRGHRDSVNSIAFQNYSNFLVTGSADSTVVLWDTRTGLATYTLQGHENAVNHAQFNEAGDTIASVDADGVVKLWDVRMGSQRASADVGPEAGNKCAFDASGSVLAIASDDNTTKLLDATTLKKATQLQGHYDSVSSVLFDPSGDLFFSASADGTVRTWA